MSYLITTGCEFWNAERTEGYRFLAPFASGQRLSEIKVKPLGSASEPVDGTHMPIWFTEMLGFFGDYKNRGFKIPPEDEW